MFTTNSFQLEIETEGRRQTYQYDSLHRRIRAGDKRMLYIGQNEIGAVDANGTLTELRVLGEGRGAEIGAAVAIELQGHIYAVHHDISGNVVALVNHLGYVSEAYRYSAFGEEQIADFRGERLPKSRLDNPWRFSSKRTDEFSGLVYFGRRYYQPENGRWLTPDPLSYDAGPNLYAYVSNNPLTHMDLYGLYALPSFDYSPSRGSMFSRSAFASSILKGTSPLGGIYGPILLRSAQAACDFVDCRTRASGSYAFTIPGKKIPGVRVSFTCGIGYSDADCRKTGKFFSDICGGCEVRCICNATDSVWDLARVGRMALGYGTDAVSVQTKEFIDDYIGASAERPDPRLYANGHSQGASVIDQSLKQIPKDWHSSMHIRTFGGTTMISQGRLGSVVNVVSMYDYCSAIACPLETLHSMGLWCCGRSNPKIQYVQGSSLLYDHGFFGTYSKSSKSF